MRRALSMRSQWWQTLAIPMSAMSGLTHEREYCSGYSVEPRAWSARCEWFPIGSGETLYVDDMYFSTQGYVGSERSS